MSSGLDLSQFYETFFDEADELLAQMEQLLLELDVGAPDIEMCIRDSCRVSSRARRGPGSRPR